MAEILHEQLHIGMLCTEQWMLTEEGSESVGRLLLVKQTQVRFLIVKETEESSHIEKNE